MDLRTGYPYSLITNGLISHYPKLLQNKKKKVTILGGGVSGALTAWFLTNAGIECILLDARSVGTGSTCASTSLLQYELDLPLCKLSKLVGFQSASTVYKICENGVDEFLDFTKKLKVPATHRKSSLYFAAYKKDCRLLKEEFELRKKIGLSVSFYDETDMQRRFSFSAPCGIFSQKAASTDAYVLTHHLLKLARKKGLEIYDRTHVTDIQYNRNGVKLTTAEGFEIHAHKLVNATGYEVVNYIGNHIVKLHSTYAFASESIDTNMKLPDHRILYWNSADPYYYMRVTGDKRIIAGGRDEEFYSPHLRDKLIKKKTKQLVIDFSKIFPGVKVIPEFSWTGTFGITKDSLPYIGEFKKTPHTYYALGFGGNGILFSYLAAKIITDLITGKKNSEAKYFSFDR